MVVIGINVTAVILLGWSFFKDRGKTRKALQIALKKGKALLPMLLILLVFMGLVFAFLPPKLIRTYLGGELNALQLVLAALFGTLTMIPSLISLPLAGSLVDAGASYTTVAAFVTTLTMVGVVTLPLELAELGRRITLWRNLLAFLAAVAISVIIGVIM